MKPETEVEIRRYTFYRILYWKARKEELPSTYRMFQVASATYFELIAQGFSGESIEDDQNLIGLIV
ncbi:hypothetical protein [Pseudomonas phage LUZ7]|uniref:Uncharacterized protein n=1 Tax=Pseudomonas phage LUZ7 TaxID=655097 RepID=C8ZKK2_9CAUD|nr:hypothetical protein PP-LUZ7_gp103 [Pseudomonas phage LUZ7]CAZ66244.1 hypothetical protein [Pseudomonas phage LUZ7]